MSRRTSKIESTALLYLFLIGGSIFILSLIFEAVGFIIPIVFILILIAVIILIKSQNKKKRLLYLRNKYKDEEIVQKIFSKFFWQGQTAEQLIDSIGRPEATDQVTLKTKKKEIWKYHRKTRTRFGLRITLENDIVIGWDQK